MLTFGTRSRTPRSLAPNPETAISGGSLRAPSRTRRVHSQSGLAESFLAAARAGDWRAADALMNRIYGKPDAALVAHVPLNPAIDGIRAISLDEKLELLGRLREGELVSTAPAPPAIEAVPPLG